MNQRGEARKTRGKNLHFVELALEIRDGFEFVVLLDDHLEEVLARGLVQRHAVLLLVVAGHPHAGATATSSSTVRR